MKTDRKVEIIEDGSWKEIDFKGLKTGDSFRMFEEDGTPVCDGDETVFIAQSDPYNDEGVLTIVTIKKGTK